MPFAQLTFAGASGMYSYSLGIASIIQQNFDLTDVHISGCSTGCFPALLLVLKMNIDTYFETWNIPLLAEVNNNLFGAVGIWNNVVRKWTSDILPGNAYLMAKNRFYCSLTHVPSLQNQIIGDWKSNEDLIDGIMASAFIPLFDVGKLTAKFRGKRYIDGSLTNSALLPRESEIPNLIIRTDMWRENNKKWWISSDEDWNRQLYAWGKADATKHFAEIGGILLPIKIQN